MRPMPKLIPIETVIYEKGRLFIPRDKEVQRVLTPYAKANAKTNIAALECGKAILSYSFILGPEAPALGKILLDPIEAFARSLSMRVGFLVEHVALTRRINRSVKESKNVEELVSRQKAAYDLKKKHIELGKKHFKNNSIINGNPNQIISKNPLNMVYIMSAGLNKFEQKYISLQNSPLIKNIASKYVKNK